MTDTTITIITTTEIFAVSGTRWKQDDSGDVYVYAGDSTSDPVATIDADEFVAAVRGSALPDDSTPTVGDTTITGP